jgi:hypothetical protein
MPVRRAIANGNWSNTATWFGGALPTNGDTVAANGFTVTIDQNVTIGGANNPSVNAGAFVTGQWYQITSLGTTVFTNAGAGSNAVGVIFQATNAGSGTGVATELATLTTAAIAAASAAAGGGFTITTAFTLAADIRAGTTTCLTVTGSGNVTYTSLNLIAGPQNNANAVQNNSTGTLSLVLCTCNGGGTNNAFSVNNAATGSLVVNNCTVTGGVAGSSHAIVNGSTGSITATSCNFTGGGSQAAFGLINLSTGSITVNSCNFTASFTTGNVCLSGGNVTATSCNFTGGVGAGSIAYSHAGTLNVTLTLCTFTAGAGVGSHAFSGSNTAATPIISGSQFDSANGTVAVYCVRYRIGTTPSLMQYRKAGDGTSTFMTLFTSDFGVFGNPSPANVRTGVSYGDGSLTGTAAIPPAGSVALGVPVDATTGTAVLTPSAVQAALLPLL